MLSVASSPESASTPSRCSGPPPARWKIILKAPPGGLAPGPRRTPRSPRAADSAATSAAPGASRPSARAAGRRRAPAACAPGARPAGRGGRAPKGPSQRPAAGRRPRRRSAGRPRAGESCAASPAAGGPGSRDGPGTGPRMEPTRMAEWPLESALKALRLYVSWNFRPKSSGVSSETVALRREILLRLLRGLLMSLHDCISWPLLAGTRANELILGQTFKLQELFSCILYMFIYIIIY